MVGNEDSFYLEGKNEGPLYPRSVWGEQLDSGLSLVSPIVSATCTHLLISSRTHLLHIRTHTTTHLYFTRIYHHTHGHRGTHSPLDTRSSIHSFATSSWSLSNEFKAVRLSFKP